MPERTDATVRVSKLADGVSFVSGGIGRTGKNAAIPDIAVIYSYANITVRGRPYHVGKSFNSLCGGC